jgi:putative membrane protein
MARPLLSEADKEAISDAVRRAEATTSGEIVFALTDASARYQHAILQGALAGMVAATALYLALPLEHTIGITLWTQLVSFAAFLGILPRLPWRRWFISDNEMDARVQEAAFREFYASGLFRTRDANGILIYLSHLESRVVVLGDRGINKKLEGDHHWDLVRDTIIQGIHKGKASEGICTAIEICGKVLSEHFPHQPDDINELPDRVIDRSVASDAP